MLVGLGEPLVVAGGVVAVGVDDEVTEGLAVGVALGERVGRTVRVGVAVGAADVPEHFTVGDGRYVVVN